MKYSGHLIAFILKIGKYNTKLNFVLHMIHFVLVYVNLSITFYIYLVHE